jgi:hypothetical protein
MTRPALLPVHRGAEIVTYALVDEEDLPQLEGHRWRLHGAGYVVRVEDGRRRYLHRELMGVGDYVPGGLVIDHVWGVRTDNRRAVLRATTQGSNAGNRWTARGQ